MSTVLREIVLPHAFPPAQEYILALVAVEPQALGLHLTTHVSAYFDRKRSGRFMPGVATPNVSFAEEHFSSLSCPIGLNIIPHMIEQGWM